LTPRFVYDSHNVWTIQADGTGFQWLPYEPPTLYGQGGWTLSEGTSYSKAYWELPLQNCYVDQKIVDTAGTQHWFRLNIGPSSYGCPSTGSAYATDSSGIQLQATGVNGSVTCVTGSAFAPDGTLVWQNTSLTSCSTLTQGSILSEDSNGNEISITGTYADSLGGLNLQDTLGRALVTPTSCSTGYCYAVANASGGTSMYTLTFVLVPVSSNFGESGVQECNTSCNLNVLQSIQLPDGTSYTFKYDCYQAGNSACNSPAGQSGYYGLLTAMTLPTGATISYGYTTFGGVSWGNGNNQYPSRWLTSKSSSAGTWSFTPLVTAGAGPGNTCLPNFNVGCMQTEVQRPDFSIEIVSLIVDPLGGSWPQEITSYDVDQAILSTVTNTWDFSNLCTLAACFGSFLGGMPHYYGYQEVRKLTSTTYLPVPGGSVVKQTTYAYDSPQTGNITAIKEWKYQPTASFSSTPDRATYITYTSIGIHNNINHPTILVVCNNTGTDSDCPGGGSKVSKATVTYDAYGANGSLALASVAGAVNHDDTNFGGTYTARGNPTQVSRWVSASSTGSTCGSTCLTTALSYDTTGQVIQSVDPNNNPTSYSYTDAYYDDNGADPPAAHTGAPTTNAYVTTVTDAIGTNSMGYYYGTGQSALATDYDGDTTYSHYVDPFSRPTKTDYPIGWSLNTYTSPTQADSYAAVGDTTASTACVSCTHTQALLDVFGRVTSQFLVNNPAGQSQVTSTYDSLNRVVSASHPNFGSTDPNDVSETLQYDALGRTTTVIHPDAESSHMAYGANVVNFGGLSTQRGSTATYGYGFPIVSLDEASNPRQEWLDGFGHVIEVDEPTGSPTHSTGSFSIGGAFRCIQPPTACDAGTVKFTVGTYTASVVYSESTQPTTSNLASAIATQLNTSGLVTATVSGAQVTMTSVGTGSLTDYVCSGSVTSSYGYNPPSFSVNISNGCMTGGGIPLSLATFYTYDALGNLTGVVQGSQTRSYQYDGLSRMTQDKTPEAGTVTVSYVTTTGALCSGNPSNACSRAAPAPNQSTGTVTITYTYDTANRLKQKTYSDTTGTVTYLYKTAALGKGLLSEMTDPSGTETYQYDKLKRVSVITKTIGSTSYGIDYTYNAGSQLTEIVYPSGRSVFYNYDHVGHLCQVATASASDCNAVSPYLTMSSANYDAADRPLSATYGNGVVASAVYSPQTAELTSLSYAKGSTTLFGLNYYYQQDSTHCPAGNTISNNGQIQCIADVSSGTGAAGRSVAYTYDQLGRLLTANTNGSTQYPAWGLSWTYDRYGNRTAQTVTAGSGFNVSYTVNAANNQFTTAGFSYDGPGNVIAAPGGATFTYDAQECNTGYTGNGSATYTCDGNGLRVKKVVTGSNAVTTVYIRSGGQVLAEYDNGAATASPTREYLYGNNLLATVTGSSGGSGGTIVYQHRDTLSPRLYTDANGNDIGEQGTYPFGESWYNNNSTSNWVYTSYERDAESGNDYALARSFASTEGRFLSPDPLEGHVGDPQSWNRYAYVENDPINLSDPSGQGFWEDLGLAIASVFVDLLCQACIPAMTAVDEGAAAAQTADRVLQGILVATRVVMLSCTVVGTGEDCGGGGPGGAGSGGNTGTVDTNPGGNTSSGSSNPGGGPGAGTAQDTGASGQGPGGQGIGAPGSWGAGGADTPIPGSTLPNGNGVVEMDIWHNHAGCEGCGDLWGHAARTMNTVTKVYGIAFGSVMVGAVAALSGPTLGGSGALLDPLVANSEKVLVQTDTYHNFGELVGRQAMRYGEQAVQNGWYRQWNISGIVNGARGVLQYGGTLSPLGTVVYITHTFFQRF